jgi:NAD(P)-dependent dehydrogenase (short-subunit alcohol dehydrogenase family)
MPASSISFDFTGQSVLVTGGTSGIGEAVAIAFAESGANVVITGRNRERGKAVVEKVSGSSDRISFIAGDITDSNFCKSLVDQSALLLKTLDVVVNCAGVIYHANIEQTTDEIWHETMNVNVNGTFYVCRAAVELMKSTGGVILNIASDAGLSASTGLTAYNTSKAAVIQLSRSMAKDYGRNNIRVIPVCPGDVDTPMLRGEFRQNCKDAETGLKESAESVPLNRVCSAEEVADLVLYAASDSARFMSGYPLVLDATNRA